MTVHERLTDQSGRIGYLVLYLMGVPVGLLLVMQQYLRAGLTTLGAVETPPDSTLT